MTEQFVPIFRVKDAEAVQGWYERLGFEVTGKHRFEPHLPLFLFLDRNGVRLFLSEHRGDAPKRSLAYLYVEDVNEVAAEFGVDVEIAPWGPEVDLVDPDGNRIRVGRAAGD